MNSKMSIKRKIIKWLPFFCFLLFSYYLHSQVDMREWDDYVYKEAWKQMSVLQWIKEFYEGWSGRIPLQMLDIIFLQFPIIVWRVCDTLLYTLAVIMVSKVARLFGDGGYKTEVITNILTCIVFVVIPKEVLNRVVLWIAGSFNYLLPTVCLLIAIYPFCKILCQKTIKKVDVILAFVGAYLCCYAEQTAAIYICLSGCILLYIRMRRRNVDGIYIGLFIFGLINMIIEYIAPGNYVRYDSEVILWYNQYDMYSILDKLLLGMTFCVKMLLAYGWLLFLIIYLLLVKKIWNETWGSRLIYIGAGIYSILLRYVLLKVTPEWIFSLSNIKARLLIFGIVFWILLITCLLYVAYCEKTEKAMTISLLALAVFASGTVPAMSPSCYEAEQRTFFISYVLLILIIGIQGQSIGYREESQKKKGQKNEKIY